MYIPTGVPITKVAMTPRGYLFSFVLLGEEFLVTNDGEHERVIRNGDEVAGASSWYWVIGPSRRVSLVDIVALKVKDDGGSYADVIYLLDFWVGR